MFSTKPTIPTTLILVFLSARALMTPTTEADPPISYFMSPIPAAGFNEIPPVSKVTPLPTKHIGSLSSSNPLYFITTNLDSLEEPWPTPSSAPIPRLRIWLSPRTSTSIPSGSNFSNILSA